MRSLKSQTVFLIGRVQLVPIGNAQLGITIETNWDFFNEESEITNGFPNWSCPIGTNWQCSIGFRQLQPIGIFSMRSPKSQTVFLIGSNCQKPIGPNGHF
uniref:Putative secreted protein n=1 Tax=Ixodes ricinus TaxID=34613 RepID=A0A6B0UBP8_IXORI